MYSRIHKLRKRNIILVCLSFLSICTVILGLFIVKNHSNVSSNFTSKAKAEVIEKSSVKSSPSKKEDEVVTTNEQPEVTSDNSSNTDVEQTVTESLSIPVQETLEQQTGNTVFPMAYDSSSVAISNGNTAGEVGASAAAQMAAATGLSQTVWEQIIARESNGNPYVSNGSGASGLFQTMPGWGSTATVQDQINSAINAYNAQGLSAWGY